MYFAAKPKSSLPKKLKTLSLSPFSRFPVQDYPSDREVPFSDPAGQRALDAAFP